MRTPMRPLLLGLALWSLTFAACGVDEDSDAEDSGSDVADVDAGSDDTGDDGSTSDDSDGSGDLGDVADWTPPEPRDPDEPPAVEPHESRPATLLFHVEDEAGAAVQGTAIDVFGRSVLTDARGDARLERLPTGEYIVGLRKSGYAEQVRTVELSRGSVTRLVFTLRARPEAVTFDAADGGTVAHSDLSLEFGPDAFIDVRGQRYDGVVSVTLTAFGADAESLLAFPAPLVAEDSAGETTYLETLGAFDVSVLGEDGQPLALAGDERVTARLALPADSERALGDLVPMWSLDPTTALWHEEAGVVAEVVEGDGGQSLWVELPHVSVWNFDTKAAQSCYWIHIRNADNFLGAVELEVIGPGYRRRAVVQDFDINVVRVPPGPTTAILYIGGVELDRIDFIAVPVTDGNCPEYELFARDAIDRGGGG